MSKYPTLRQIPFAITLGLYLFSASADGQTTAFTYQGKLTAGGTVANGNYDFEFRLFDSLSGGVQQGTTQTLTGVAVTGGIFTVRPDFGNCPACFNGFPRFLDISVRQPAGSFTPLAPRQEVSSNPYAIRSLNAATADGLDVACVSCVTSSQIQSVSGSAVSGAIPVASVPPGSDNYIQNTGSTQPSANFNIGGNGVVGARLGIGTSAPGFKLEVVDPGNTGLRVQNNTAGGTIASFGGAGAFNIDASGQPGGRLTVLENGKVGIGSNPPAFRLDVFDQTTAGLRVQTNTSGGTVASFGRFGNFSIDSAIPGGRFSILENGNVGIGANNPSSKLHISGTGITRALVDSDSNAGFRLALNNQSKWSLATLAGGNFQIFNEATGQNAVWINTANNIGIGVTSPASKLHVFSTGIARALIDSDSNAGLGLALNNQSKWSLATVTGGNFQIFNDTTGQNAVWINTADNNVGIGTSQPTSKLEVSATGGNTPMRVVTDTAGGTLASFGGFGRVQIDAPGATGGRLNILEDGSVGINMKYFGDPQDMLQVRGDVRAYCFKYFDGTPLIGVCLSDERLKRNITPFESALEKLARLRPVHFDWRSDEYPELNLGSKRAYGLIAQDVEKVFPEMVTEDPRGFKAVNYSELSLFLLQGIRELKAENDALRQEMKVHNEQFQKIEQFQMELQEVRAKLGIDPVREMPISLRP